MDSKTGHPYAPTQLRHCSYCSFFRSTKFMRIFAAVLGQEASNDSGVIENVDFSAFGRYNVTSSET